MNKKALLYVRLVTDAFGCELLPPCDVTKSGLLAAVFERIRSTSRLPAARNRLCARGRSAWSHDGLQPGRLWIGEDVSCHSFLGMARLAKPLMLDGSCPLTVTFYGSERVVANYDLTGPVKAVLKSAVRYTAARLGQKQIRANSISPGAVSTRTAGGIAHFDEVLAAEAAAAPECQLVYIEDVGVVAAFLVSDGARHIMERSFLWIAGSPRWRETKSLTDNGIGITLLDG